MDTLILKTYIEEVEIIAGGWHDTKATHIQYQYSLDKLVNMHESIHDKIYHSCPDSFLLSMMVFALKQIKQGKIGSESQDLYNEVAKNLFGSSKFPQEVFATYLSIKSLDAKDHDDAFARHPLEYKEYYQYLASVIDPIFKSSYLQYAVAQNISTIVFSSPFLGRFLSELPYVVPVLASSERPDARLAVMIDMFLTTDKIPILLEDLQSIAELAAFKHGFKPWDLTSEDGWMYASNIAVEEMNYAIAAYLLEWLPKESGLEFCDPTDETADLFVKFVRTLGAEFHFSPADRSSANYETKIMSDAYAASRSVLVNGPLPIIQDTEYLTWNLDVSHRMSIGGAASDVKDLDFVSWPVGKGRSPLFIHISDLALEYLTAESHAANIISNLDAIVLGIGKIDDMEEWYRRLPYLIFMTDGNEVLRAAGRLGFVTFWYCHGDYITWLKSLRKPIFYSTVGFGSSVFEHGGAIAKFFRLDDKSNQFFMRVFSIQAAEQLEKYEKKMVENGDLIVEKIFKSYEDKFTAAWNLCSMMWSEL